MKYTATAIFSIAILATIVSAQTDEGEKKAPLPGFKLLTDAPLAVDKRKTTTQAPPTTTTSTSTTTASTPTTTASTSTTTTTTEAPKTTSSTTAAPDTTSTVAPTTTAAPPVPTPEPTMGKWNLTDGKNVCVILYAAIQLKVPYVTTENVSQTVLHNVPAALTRVAPETCNNGTKDQRITIEWGPVSSPSSFLLLFGFNATTSQYSVKEITVALNTYELPHGKNETIMFWNTENLFAVPQGMSYHCTRNQTLNMTDTEQSNKTVAWAFVSHLQFEAYHKGSIAQFSYAKDCDAIDTPDIVPIAVGCALIALVVVVLIAYLVGRRRAQARGYISM